MSWVETVGGGRLPDPSEVVGYLRSTKWSRVYLDNGRSSVWANVDGTREVFVPLRAEASDYGPLLCEALKTIALVEGRTTPAVADDMKTTSADVVRIRRVGHVADLLPLDMGAKFFASAANVVVAAACAAYEPRASYGPRKAAEITDFTRQAGFDRTETGSFVIKIVCPLVPKIIPAQAGIRDVGPEPSHPPPFPRKTTEMLVQALEAARSAATNAIASSDLDYFVKMVNQGVSSNLCSALGEMGNDTSLREVEVHVTWARTWPRRTGPDRITLSREVLGIMSQGAERLAEVDIREDHEVIGAVVSASRETGDGEVRISTYLDGKPRKVRVELGSAEYSQAVAAHAKLDDGALIRLFGDLVKEGRVYRLQRPRRLEVLMPDDEPD